MIMIVTMMLMYSYDDNNVMMTKHSQRRVSSLISIQLTMFVLSILSCIDHSFYHNPSHLLISFPLLTPSPVTSLRYISIKKSSPDVPSLKEYFDFSYGAPYSLVHQKAVQNFVKSLVGYSLITYLLQVPPSTSII